LSPVAKRAGPDLPPAVLVYLACAVGQGENRPRRIKVREASVSAMHQFVSDDTHGVSADLVREIAILPADLDATDQLGLRVPRATGTMHSAGAGL
jgi:hypothetical protein